MTSSYIAYGRTDYTMSGSAGWTDVPDLQVKVHAPEAMTLDVYFDITLSPNSNTAWTAFRIVIDGTSDYGAHNQFYTAGEDTQFTLATLRTVPAGNHLVKVQWASQQGATNSVSSLTYVYSSVPTTPIWGRRLIVRAQATPAGGCADGSREGFISETTYPDIAACAGTASGSSIQSGAAQSLCAPGWHLCNQTDRSAILTKYSYSQATAFGGCFGFDAAHDNNACVPYAPPASGVNDFDDLAGAGDNCGFKQSTAGSCFTGGRVDVAGSSMTGVLCCRP